MRLYILLLFLISFTSLGYSQTCPTSVRVGSSCGSGTSCSPCSTSNCCHNCTGTIDVVAYETYVKRVLPQEWLNCWGSQTGGMNSLQAGAVAIRSYTIPRISALTSCHGANYDICRTTCCHVYSTTQQTNSNNAVDITAYYILVSGSTVQLTEYAAEQNNHSSCGNGFKGNGTGTWPCTSDGPCTGQSYNGHGRGMCQNGSARWATGLNFVNSSCTWQTSHGYGTKTWQQILSHYYPSWTLTTCGTPTPPPTNNDCASATTLTPSSSCNYQTFSTLNATQSIAATSPCNGFTNGNADDDVWFKFTANAGQAYTVRLLNGTSFDGVVDLRTGSCNGSSVACDDQPGNTGVVSSVTYTPSTTQTLYVRVYHYGSGSGGGSFQICVITSCTAPSQPVSISGATTVCQNGLHQYSVSSVSGATSYTWTLPSGWLGSSTTNSINTSAGSSSGTISVRANNSCGSSSTRTLSVTVQQPLTQPGSIQGNTTVCEGSSQTYSISSLSGASSYTWTLPSGWSGSSNGTSITTTVGSSNGIITVQGNNTCAGSSSRSLSITVNPTPARPGSISGNQDVCAGTSNQYSISTISGATSYTWSYSGGGTPSGNGTNITLNANSSGTLSVTANNSCGSSSSRTLSINVTSTPSQPGSISGNNNVCGGSQSYSISSVSGATSYSWTYSGGGTINGTGTSINFTPASSGTLSVIAINSCGSSSQRTLSITVTSAPSQPGNISGSTTLCQGTSQSYFIGSVSGATSYTWTYSGGGNPSGNGTSINFSPSTSGTLSVVANSSCGSSAPRNLTINVNQAPSAIISPSTNSTCSGDLVTLTASGGGSYQWSTGASSTSINVNPTNTTQYDVTVTLNGCTATASQTITVNPLPNITISPAAPTVCSGLSATLTASGGNNYVWSNGDTGPTITVSPSVSTTYMVTVTAANGCTATQSKTVTVSSVAGAMILPASASICSGGTTTLTASGGTGYVWSNGANTASITVSPTSTTTYIVTVTNNGCSVTLNSTVTVSSTPTASISTPNPLICSGESTTLTATGGTGYTWSNGANTASITVSPASTNTYTVTVTSSGCTSTANASQTVTVNPSPTANITPQSTTICSGETTLLTAGGNGSYLWSDGSTTASISVSPTTTTTYTVTVTLGTCSASASQTISVVGGLSTAISPQAASICSGDNVVLTANGGGNYQWSTGATTTSITVSPLSTTTYNVTMTAGGCSATQSAIVTVNQTPYPFSVNPPSISICPGGSGVQLESFANAQSYLWSPSAGLNSTIDSIVVANPSSTTTYTVVASNGNCSTTASSTITVSSQLTATIHPLNPVICLGGSVSLSATSGTTHLWSGPNGYTSYGQSITISTPGTYSVTVTTPGGCAGLANTSVVVIQNPTLIVDAGNNQAVSLGGTALLGGAPTASAGTPPYSYLWDPAATLNNPGIANPSASPTVNTTYNLIVTDINGCTATDDVSVTINACQSFALDSLAMNIPFNAGTYSVNLSAGVGCPWTVIEACSWLNFLVTSGNGSATLTFTVDENPLTSQRTCFVNVEGQILIVTQDAGCIPPVANFSGSPQTGLVPFSVTYTDLSTNAPTQWEWTFQGGNPTTSILANPIVEYIQAGAFDVTLKVTNSCGSYTDTKANYINIVTGIGDIILSENISVYPNPNTGMFKIIADVATSNPVEISIYSTLGQLLYSEQIMPISNKIDKDVTLANVTSGIYLVQLKVDGRAFYQKLVIE